ncbi:MAG: hypothetical protein IIW82_01330 [Clostridia bacterium]|nr:hypothetical protein [Clostridia bacterium]
MKYNYTVEVTVGDHITQNATYENVEKALDAAKKAVLDYANEMRVHDYISHIRQGINKGYRALVADYWAEFFSTPKFSEMTHVVPFEEDPDDYEEELTEENTSCDDEKYEYEEPPKDPLDDFFCGVQEFDITEFYFGHYLHMETNWYQALRNASHCERLSDKIEEEGFEYSEQLVFDMSTREHRVVVTVSRSQKTTHSENIVLVYRSLSDYPHSREVIQSYIWEDFGAVVSLKTIGNHLDTLRKLGVPVAYKGINRYTLDQQNGYYLDPAVGCGMNREEVASLGTSVNCLLVLFALQQASGPMRQADIIRWIDENYGIKIGRVAVSRQMDSLSSMRYYIKKSKDGYILQK